MISTYDLSKQFDEFWAVEGVNLEVRAGEVLALLGPNGAGKTTTVRMLTSVLRPTRGWARVAGYDTVREAPRVRAAIGLLTEQHGLYGRMSADEYLDFFGQLYGMPLLVRQKRIARLLEDFGLISQRKRPLGEYSKGMRQKLALARALLHDPAVLLLDEPTSAMDPESAHLVRDSIRRLRSADRAIVICTHNLSEAEDLADQIAIIRNGKIIVEGTPEALKRTLLGPPEYEVQFACQLDGQIAVLPQGVHLTTQGQDWLRYRTNQPEKINPLVLRVFLDQNLPVLSLQEVPASLEQVYLQAISESNELEKENVG